MPRSARHDDHAHHQDMIHVNDNDHHDDNNEDGDDGSPGSPVASVEERLINSSENLSCEKQETGGTRFAISKEISERVDDKKWDDMFSDKKNMLPYNWPKYMANILSEYFPNCCLNFKRRKLYPENSKYVLKCFIYCNIAGCSLESTVWLLKTRYLTIRNKKNIIGPPQRGTKKFYVSLHSRRR